MRHDLSASNMSIDNPSYDDIHYIKSLDLATEEDLRSIVRSFPVIDNHAHNILQEEHAHNNQEIPFESVTSEAQGHALHDHVHTSLAHIRGINQLADLFNCRPTLNDVKSSRYEWIRRDYPSLVQRCLQGTHALMIDDGLAPEAVHSIKWHQQLVPTVSRIVRIESLAAELLQQLAHSAGFMKLGPDASWDKDRSENVLVRFNNMYRSQIRNLAQDPHVRGFKSVICYRTGLDVGLESRNLFRPHQSLTKSLLLSSFHDFFCRAVRTHKYRIEQKHINDYLVVAVCDVLDKLNDTDGESVPIQFHTGLGDTDLDLVTANPAYMKPLFTAFPHVDFVMLHASYPYTREAGYMASLFANVWLDIGLVFPMLSRDGQEAALRHALEMTPASKIVWSTDGHLHPETYYLANRQFRIVLEKVLVEYVRQGDLSVVQAINSAVDILFWNSNQLYKLDEERKYPQLVSACGRSSRGAVQHRDNSSSITESFDSHATTSVDPGTLAIRSSVLLINDSSTTNTAANTMTSTLDHDVAVFDAFFQANRSVKYIWLQVIDYTGSTRQRMIPVAAFRKCLSSGKYPSVTSALPNLLQNDTVATSQCPTGEMKMKPDLSSLCLNTVLQSPSATIQTWLMEDEGHHFACPRWGLQKHVDALQAEFGLTMLMGFEVEIVFMRPVYTTDKSDFIKFEPFNTVHHWSSMTYQDLDVLPMIEEIVEALATVGIVLDQFHAEAAPGQWEFPLPAHEPVKAVDVLYKAREIIRWVAHKHGLKATLYPRPFSFTAGSASHAHFSINGDADVVKKYEDPFLAGILLNLPSIVALSLPLDESYARVAAHVWSGGEWICWGTQNREAPIRKCGLGHWELKAIDGIGNMYLSMAALVSSGLAGLRENLELTCKDNPDDSSEMSAEQRKALGITALLPKKLSESVGNLEKNKILRSMMGDAVIDQYVANKRAEMKALDARGEDERKAWLIARY